MDPYQFNRYVLVPALNVIGLYSSSANSLMLGTALQESNLDHLRKDGTQGTLGIYQIEEKIYGEINRYLSRFDNIKLKERCISACFYSAWPPHDTVVHNLRWAVIIARVKYSMLSTPIPAHDDARALSSYYNRFYNPSAPKAEMAHLIPVFEEAIRIIND